MENIDLINISILEICETFRPPPRLKISEYADQKRKLSAESSADPGQYNTSRTEYARGIMDAFNEPDIHTVVVMSSAQVAKTTIIENVIAYYIEQDPSPIMIMQPTLEMAKAFSKDRLAPMIRDMPTLNGIVSESKAKTSGNEILHKTFSGGHITMSGANSPATIAQRPIRIALGDDVDRFPFSAGDEGDPANLLFKRTTAFWNKKRGLFSTPTVKDSSRIEKAYNGSDMRKYFVPCLDCKKFQVLKWSNVQWKENKPETAHYVCDYCGSVLNDADINRAVKKGEWRKDPAGINNGIAGFWLNEIYSPFVALAEMAEAFLTATKEGPESLKVFINTSLAETWEEKAETIKDGTLFSRRKDYFKDEKIPHGVGFLTLAADVQGGGDLGGRIEYEIRGWGAGLESWGIIYGVLLGDPIRKEVWKRLHVILNQLFTHVSGAKMKISAAFIDSGYAKDEVYDFCRPLLPNQIYPCKGSSIANYPLIGTPRKQKENNMLLAMVGTDAGKDIIHSRLQVKEPGPGYMHFPMSYDQKYFDMITSQKVIIIWKAGIATRDWIPKTRGRAEEALDIMVYGVACAALVMPVNIEELVKSFSEYSNPDYVQPGPDPKSRRRVISKGVKLR